MLTPRFFNPSLVCFLLLTLVEFAGELGPNAGHCPRVGHGTILPCAEPSDPVHHPAGGEGGGFFALPEGRPALPKDKGAEEGGQVGGAARR